MLFVMHATSARRHTSSRWATEPVIEKVDTGHSRKQRQRGSVRGMSSCTSSQTVGDSVQIPQQVAGAELTLHQSASGVQIVLCFASTAHALQKVCP